MAEYNDDELGVRLTIPDEIPVRQQLRYRSASAFYHRADAYERFWEGAKELIDEWECEALPDKSVSLDEVTDPAVTDIIFWACNAVSGHLNRLGDVPKNE